MSEYQYYEFIAADRPLTSREQGALRSLSTRAEITASSFVNTYQWGDFKGDPRTLMERYFDAHLYLANWGTRDLMLRLPARVLDPARVAGYCVGDHASAWTSGEHVIVHVRRENEDDEGAYDSAEGLWAEREQREAEERERDRVRRERSAAAARQRHLDALAVDQPAAWQQVDGLIAAKKQREYDTAVQLLVDLRDLAERDGDTEAYQERLTGLRATYARRPSLLERLELAGLDD